MKLTYQINQMRFELNSDSAKELFAALAEVQNIFEAERKCGRCESGNLHCRVRTMKEGDFYELFCLDCASTFPFGQTREGSLFPKRKDAEGMFLSHRGWRPPYTGKDREPEYAEERPVRR